VFWQGKKFIKFYGSNLVLQKVLDIPEFGIFSETYENILHTTIHSDIARNSNNGIMINKIDEGTAPTDPSFADLYKLRRGYDDYVMVCNNFFSPKIYEITDPSLKVLKLSFVDNKGMTQPVFSLARRTYNALVDGGTIVDDAEIGDYQEGEVIECHETTMETLIFKIECELIVL
jgi:hypothetical protein